MKKNILFFIHFLFLIYANAQSLSPNVIASSGDYFLTTTLTMDWTLGEPITETFIGTNNTITQGFQQCSYSFATIEDYGNDNFSIFLFPNPTSDIINFSIRSKNNEKIVIALFDLLGKKLFEESFSSLENILSLKSFTGNVFILKITINDKPIKTYKIIKSE